jgi:predicted kinase
MKTVQIYRGLPGTGKSTLALKDPKKAAMLKRTDAYCSADAYFVDDEGNYDFVGWQVPIAHQWCWGKFIDAVAAGHECIVVDNTNTQRWEYENYIKLAKIFDYSVEIINTNESGHYYSVDSGWTDMALAERNVHGVPAEAIVAMRERWEVDPDEVKV